jgi:hypothetical protein
MRTIAWVSLLAGCASAGGFSDDDEDVYGDVGDDDAPAGDSDTDTDVDSDADTDADSDSDTGDDGPAPEHGTGDCGHGGLGDPLDFSHMPTCPSDPHRWQVRYQASRSVYYGDGLHVFEPEFVNWDDDIAAVAQEYAEAYAGGMSPTGQIYSDISFDPWWLGEYGGYTAVAGMESPTSCDCDEPKEIGGFETGAAAHIFYYQGGGYFRSYVIRMHDVSRMGVGHVAPGDGSHYWTILFAP